MQDGPVTTDSGSAAPEPQAVIAPLTGAAIFLVVVVTPGEDSADAVRSLCADRSALVRAVGFRDLDGHLSCVTGFGAAGWDRIAGPAHGTPSPPRGTCYSTSAPPGWTCVSNSPARS